MRQSWLWERQRGERMGSFQHILLCPSWASQAFFALLSESSVRLASSLLSLLLNTDWGAAKHKDHIYFSTCLKQENHLLTALHFYLGIIRDSFVKLGNKIIHQWVSQSVYMLIQTFLFNILWGLNCRQSESLYICYSWEKRRPHGCSYHTGPQSPAPEIIDTDIILLYRVQSAWVVPKPGSKENDQDKKSFCPFFKSMEWPILV